MPPKRIGPIAQAWYRWKALRLPWRRRFLIGFDLEGNTYWEFRLTRGPDESAERWRRIVSYPRSTHYSQVKVSPLWHQWLRHARRDAPTLDEQHAEVARQAGMRRLAAEADARWEAKPRVVEAPAPARALPPLDGAGRGGVKQQQQQHEEDEEKGASKQQRRGKEGETNLRDGDAAAGGNDPWARARAQGPGENWQPTAWNPSAATKNRS